MRRAVLTFAGLCLLLPVAWAARDEAGASSAPPSPVEKLIAELGSDEYSVRRRAEAQLMRLGPEAFDELKAAEDNPDLEIAERVRYIVQRLRITWIHQHDPPDVRRLLAQFSDLSEDNRDERIRQLAALDDNAGLRALCRIARFDQSPIVARRAALAVMKLDMSREERSAAADECLAELGSSDRPPAQWIQLYLRELEAPAATIAEWAEANAVEAALLKQESRETDLAAVYDLLQRHLDRCHELTLGAETADALLAIVEITDERRVNAAGEPFELDESDRLEAGLAWAVAWIIEHKRWDVLKPVEDRYKDPIRHSRKLLYYLASASAKAGRGERAATLAEQAFQLPKSEETYETDRVTIAKAVASLGHVDWAEREYRRVIDEEPVAGERSMEARNELAMWLHDREQYQAAADVLGEFCDALDADAAAKARLIDEIELSANSGREVIRNVEARREFYLACVEEARGDYERQRQRLDEAIKKYDKDPDILIAMYRSPKADEDYKRKTRAKIRATAKYMQALIDEYDDIPTFYNQWAWLISNTEGDQELAVEYSQRSLKLAPNEPSYLDTLGRCYFAVGDYQNAVNSQRQAVELAPQYRVMQRQLSLFERTLAETQPAAGNAGRGKDNEDAPPSSADEPAASSPKERGF